MVYCQLGVAWKIEISVKCSLVLVESTHRSARVAQWIRRRSPKPKIGGSSPPVGTNVFCWLINPCAKEVLFNISTNGAFIANIGDVAQW